MRFNHARRSLIALTLGFALGGQAHADVNLLNVSAAVTFFRTVG